MDPIGTVVRIPLLRRRQTTTQLSIRWTSYWPTNCLYLLGLQSALQQFPLENKSLQPLLASLPSILVHSRADSTVNNYFYAYQAWERWAHSYGVVPLPAQAFSFGLYLLSRIQDGSTYPVVKGAFYGVKHVHNLFMVADPTTQTLVINLLEASKRLDKHVVAKKEPITTDILRKLYASTVVSKGTLNDIRVMCFCILGYSGFLRYEEIASLRVCDLSFEPTHMKIFVEKSKTDQYRDGKWLFISNGVTELCPSKIVRMYLNKCGITDFSSDEYLFRGIAKGKTYEKLRKGNKALSYTRVREILLTATHIIEIDYSYPYIHLLTTLRHGNGPDQGYYGIGQFRDLGILFWDRVE